MFSVFYYLVKEKIYNSEITAVLKCKDFLVLFVIDVSKWKVFRIWTVGWTKEAI